MITAFTSSLSTNIQTSPQDKELAQSALTTSVQVYAEAVDTENVGATFTFSWTLLDGPSGHSATFADDTVQNPTLQNIDVWGNYRLFCIATNTSTSSTSQTDPIIAPNSAFVTIRVNSTNRGLEKPAKGERDWHSRAHEWVSAIEEGANIRVLDSVSSTSETLNAELGDLKVSSSDSSIEFNITKSNNDVTLDLSLADDVSINGNFLVNADNVAVDSLIQFKRGDGNTPSISYDVSESTFALSRDGSTSSVIMTQSDVPTTTVRGGVLLSGSSNTTGKILDKERFFFTQGADQSVQGKASGQADVFDTIRVLDGTGSLTTESKSNHSHILFRNKTGDSITIDYVTLVLLDSGTSTTVDYEFQLVTYTSTANMVTNTIATTDNLGLINRTTNYKTGDIETTSTRTVASGAYFGIKCSQECDGHLGHGLRVTIEASRSI